MMAVTLAVFSLFLASDRYFLFYSYVAFYDGKAAIDLNAWNQTAEISDNRSEGWLFSGGGWLGTVRIENSHSGVLPMIILPGWFAILLLGIPTGILFWLDRKRFGVGKCAACGYDLTGNKSGTCPECGGTVVSNA